MFLATVESEFFEICSKFITFCCNQFLPIYHTLLLFFLLKLVLKMANNLSYFSHN